MGNFIALDEPMGPGFLIFFKKVKKSNDVVNIRPPEWWYRTVDRDAFEFSRVVEIQKKAEVLSRKSEHVENAVDVLAKSKYATPAVKEFIQTRDLVGEVEHPLDDSVCVLNVLMQWFITVQIWHDDEEAILVLLLF